MPLHHQQLLLRRLRLLLRLLRRHRSTAASGDAGAACGGNERPHNAVAAVAASGAAGDNSRAVRGCQGGESRHGRGRHSCGTAGVSPAGAWHEAKRRAALLQVLVVIMVQREQRGRARWHLGVKGTWKARAPAFISR